MQSYNFNELSPWHDLLEIRVGIVFQNTTVAAISIWLTILKISQKKKKEKRKEKKQKEKNSNYVTTFAQFSCNHA